ncbi:hypothetical protein L1887_51851 [Cichorium endivia]|nr:hypothetical protein L1887_51851 [Cichorium endivia]
MRARSSGEAQHFLLVVQIALLAPGHLHAAEEALFVCDLESQQLHALLRALRQVLLAERSRKLGIAAERASSSSANSRRAAASGLREDVRSSTMLRVLLLSLSRMRRANSSRSARSLSRASSRDSSSEPAPDGERRGLGDRDGLDDEASAGAESLISFRFFFFFSA